MPAASTIGEVLKRRGLIADETAVDCGLLR